MNTTLDELESLTVEYQQRVAGRPLSQPERANVARLVDRLDQVRASLASTLAVSGAEGMRIALAGAGPAASRADH